MKVFIELFIVRSVTYDSLFFDFFRISGLSWRPGKDFTGFVTVQRRFFFVFGIPDIIAVVDYFGWMDLMGVVCFGFDLGGEHFAIT